jgi:dihydroorotate dehydrogenase (fumarate)
MNLESQYLGLKLKNPFVPSSSPLSKNLDTAKKLEDHGASAIVMYSLFEEEIDAEDTIADELAYFQDIGHGEASSYLPMHQEYASPRDNYLEQLRRLKESLGIPVIASLNGISPGGWVREARAVGEAGADGLELNVYYVAADPGETPDAVEARLIATLQEVTRQVNLPIGVKLSPYYSAVPHLVKRIEQAGAKGVALFNRFYQPDINLAALKVAPTIHLSTSHDSLLAMRWIAILYGRVGMSLAATGGVHTGEDAAKMLLCGADVTYLCSTLLINGPNQLDRIQADLVRWMEANEYESVAQLRGSLSQKNYPDPASFERGNYIKILSSYRVPPGVWR